MSTDGDTWNASGGPNYPHEKVVQFCLRRFPPEARANVRALDLGCGSGVHTAFLAREGFQARGVDVSTVGVENAQRRLRAESLTASVTVCGMEELELVPDSIDLVLCIGVLECAGLEVATEGLARVAACLAPGGCGLFLFASERDFRAGHPAIRHVYTETEVKRLFEERGWNVWYDRFITTYENGRIEQNDWLITIQT